MEGGWESERERVRVREREWESVYEIGRGSEREREMIKWSVKVNDRRTFLDGGNVAKKNGFPDFILAASFPFRKDEDLFRLYIC